MNVIKLYNNFTGALNWYAEENNQRDEWLLLLCLTFTSYPCISKQRIMNLKGNQKVKCTSI